MIKKAVFAACVWICAFGAFASVDDGDEREPVGATLEEVRGFPDAYSRVPFRVELLYHTKGGIYNPFYTRFEPSKYMNFAAWGSGTPIWTREGYTSDLATFYVDRGRHPAVFGQILQLEPMAWFEATCIVRSSSADKAWIEVIDIDVPGRKLMSADLQRMVRGTVLAQRGQYERSLIEFDAVSFGGMPRQFVALVKREVGTVALAAGQYKTAEQNLRYARAAFPRDLMIEEQYNNAVALRRGKNVPNLALQALNKPREEPAEEETEETPEETTEDLTEWPEAERTTDTTEITDVTSAATSATHTTPREVDVPTTRPPRQRYTEDSTLNLDSWPQVSTTRAAPPVEEGPAPVEVADTVMDETTESPDSTNKTTPVPVTDTVEVTTTETDMTDVPVIDITEDSGNTGVETVEVHSVDDATETTDDKTDEIEVVDPVSDWDQDTEKEGAKPDSSDTEKRDSGDAEKGNKESSDDTKKGDKKPGDKKDGE